MLLKSAQSTQYASLTFKMKLELWLSWISISPRLLKMMWKHEMPPDLAGLTRFKATNEVLNPKLITVKLKPRFKSNFDFFTNWLLNFMICLQLMNLMWLTETMNNSWNTLMYKESHSSKHHLKLTVFAISWRKQLSCPIKLKA